MQAEKAIQLEAVAKGRLLLVDDDALFRESLGQNLVDEGYEVENVDGGQAALDHLSKDETVDTVLLDWRMPGAEGIDVIRWGLPVDAGEVAARFRRTPEHIERVLALVEYKQRRKL